jgi:hypothetical protein
MRAGHTFLRAAIIARLNICQGDTWMWGYFLVEMHAKILPTKDSVSPELPELARRA